MACSVNGVVCYNNKFEFMEICSISNTVNEDYYYKDNYSVKASGSSLICRRCSEDDRTILEERLQQAIRKAEKNRADEIIGIRNFYWENYNKKQKQIWLITDRPDRAGDNAEAFYRYMLNRTENDIELYFILSRDSSSYEELSKLGNVIEPFSQTHLKLQTVADYVISSQFSQAVFNPYNDDVKYLRGLFMNAKFICVQHGVIHNAHGKVIGKYGRNFHGFVTSAAGEYNYLLDPKFHYTEKQVWLTGLPRWDRLYRDPQKIITLMPTWRKFLTSRVYDEELKTYIWNPVDNFTETEYYKFYYELINDQELLNAADKYGYKIFFMPHPVFLKLADIFRADPRVILCDYEKSYRELFAESSLVVTDYSSAVFDFSYLKQPIIYCQFDKDAFYRGHSVKKGYFDHERDGFGEVTYDLESTVSLMIEYMANGCALKPKYLKRIEDFFDYSDRSCCERLYEKIKENEHDTVVELNNT